MSSQHLSDEAVAAFADGVLRGHAHDRATRHCAGCDECAHAVRVQREAVLALRAAPAPSLPLGLADRLRTLPQTTPITLVTTVVADDGTVLLPTGGSFPTSDDRSASGPWGGFGAPMAALVPPRRQPRTAPRAHRARPLMATAAVVALTGALSLAATSRDSAPVEPDTGQVVRQLEPIHGLTDPVIAPVGLFRGGH